MKCGIVLEMGRSRLTTLIGLVLVVNFLGCEGMSADKFLDAVRSGDEAQVRSLIKQGFDVNTAYQGGFGGSALHWAVDAGHIRVVEILLKNGADVHSKARKETTPLHWAFGLTNPDFAEKECHARIAKMLIEAGADVKARDEYARTPLLGTAVRNYKNVAKLLLKRGADANASGKGLNDLPPLVIAAMKGNVEVAKVLLDGGADVNYKVEDSRTALHYAAQQGHVEMVRLLIDSGAKVDARDVVGETPLQAAVALGRKNVVELLREKGANVNEGNVAGMTPLHIAAMSGNAEMVRKLIQDGADVSARFKPVATSRRVGKDAILGLTTSGGGNGNIGDDFGDTPLHLAASVDVARVLIDHGADIGAKNEGGRTPLEQAYFLERHDVARFLAELEARKSRDGLDRQHSNKKAVLSESLVLESSAVFPDRREFGINPPGGLTPDQLKLGIRTFYSAYCKCIKEHPEFYGKVAYSLTIGTDGSLSRFVLHKNEVDQGLLACLRPTLLKLRFARPVAGTTVDVKDRVSVQCTTQ